MLVSWAYYLLIGKGSGPKWVLPGCAQPKLCVCFSIKGLSPIWPFALKSSLSSSLSAKSINTRLSWVRAINLLTWSPVLENCKLFHQVTCTMLSFSIHLVSNHGLFMYINYFLILKLNSCDIKEIDFFSKNKKN